MTIQIKPSLFLASEQRNIRAAFAELLQALDRYHHGATWVVVMRAVAKMKRTLNWGREAADGE